MFKHSEHCDECGALLSGEDIDGDPTFNGLRFTVANAEAVKVSLPGDHYFRDVSHPIQIRIRKTTEGKFGTSYDAFGLVLPGVLCDLECFLAWMNKQIEQVAKQVKS